MFSRARTIWWKSLKKTQRIWRWRRRSKGWRVHVILRARLRVILRARPQSCQKSKSHEVFPKIRPIFFLTILFAYVVIIVFKPVFYWSATKILVHFKFSPKPFPFFRGGLYSSSCQSWQFRFNEECKEPLHKIGLKSFQKVKITIYLQGRSQDFSKGGGQKYRGYPPGCHLNIVGFLLTKRLTKGVHGQPMPPPLATPFAVL